MNRVFGIGGLLLLLCHPLDSTSNELDPVLEYSQLKEKYPDYPIVSVLRKQEVNIEIDKNDVPLMQIKEIQTEMLMTETGTNFSESKEYFSSQNVIKKIEAYSLVPVKNKYKKVPVSDFQKSADFADHLYFDDTYNYTFNFPATGKGVKRCTYIEREINDPYHSLIFFFAGNIPSDHTELTLTIPENLKIVYHLYGMDTTLIEKHQTKKGKLVTYQWISHQPKVYEKDILAPGIRYFRPHIIINVASNSGKTGITPYMGTLEDLYRWEESKTGQVNKTISPEIAQLTDSVVKGIVDTTQKVRALYKWVQNNIKYIAIEDGVNGFVPREASLVLKRRYGDCKDKSSLLTTMINALGQKASLASVGTRDLPYKYSEFPSIACANHMISVWWKNGTPWYLDGTSRNNKLEDVPAIIQGKECVIENQNDHYQLFKIPIAPPSSNAQLDSFVLIIKSDTLQGYGDLELTGEGKTNVINRLEGKTKEKQRLVWPGIIFSASEKMNVTYLKTTDLNKLDIPLKADFKFSLPDYLIRQGNQIYVNMNIERDFNHVSVSPDRKVPIEVEFNLQHQINCRLNIPEDMFVSFLPAPISFTNPLFGFSQNYETRGAEVLLVTQIYINTFIIDGKDIIAFREMMEKLKKAYGQTIALSKK